MQADRTAPFFGSTVGSKLGVETSFFVKRNSLHSAFAEAFARDVEGAVPYSFGSSFSSRLWRENLQPQ